MTSLRAEAVRTLLVLTVPMAVASVFPFSAVGYRSVRLEPSHGPYMAFVTLSQSEEEAVLRTAKSAWQMEAGSVRGSQAWLPLGDLPVEAPGPILREIPPRTPPAWPRTDYAPPPWQPSLRAKPPVRIEGDAFKVEPTFPRSELLAYP